jgi:hypothetical protein
VVNHSNNAGKKPLHSLSIFLFQGDIRHPFFIAYRSDAIPLLEMDATNGNLYKISGTAIGKDLSSEQVLLCI